mgnify:CR=1 FL=1
MKIVKLQDAKVGVPPKHYNMVSLELHGMEPQGFHNLLILGQSQFLPGGGAEGVEIMADVIYYILEGAMTVKTKTETKVLEAGDSVRFEVGEYREIVNETSAPVKMLVIAGIPPKK